MAVNTAGAGCNLVVIYGGFKLVKAFIFICYKVLDYISCIYLANGVVKK